MDERKKALEAFSKELAQGLPFAEDFLTLPDKDIENNSLLARNLSEDALAHQVMKNTGVPIPGRGASAGKKEDFLNRIVQERYPEFKDPNLSIGNEDSYHKGKILVRDQDDITSMLGKSLHEAGHKYDREVLNAPRGQELDLKTLRNAQKTGLDLKNMDPAQVYEMYAKGHHAEIPNLREGTYGLGALKSMMKSGTFKQVAGALPVVGGLAAATMSGDASAAVPLLDEADDVGESKEDEAALMGESKGFKNYGQSQARQDALRRFTGK